MRLQRHNIGMIFSLKAWSFSSSPTTTSLLESRQGQSLTIFTSYENRDREHFRIAALYWLIIVLKKYNRFKPGRMVDLAFSEPSLFRFQANEVLLAIMQKTFLNTPSRKSLDRALAACPGLTWCLCEPPRAFARVNPLKLSAFSFVESKKIQSKNARLQLAKTEPRERPPASRKTAAGLKT